MGISGFLMVPGPTFTTCDAERAIQIPRKKL